MRAAYSSGGATLLNVDPLELAAFRRLKEVTQGASIDRLIELWQLHDGGDKGVLISDAIKDYKTFRKSQFVTETTHASVAAAEFLTFLPSGVATLSQITRGVLQDFIDKLTSTVVVRGNRGARIMAPKTVHGRWVFIRAWLNWCVATERLRVFPKGKIVLPADKQQEIVFLSVADVQKLFKANADVDPDICAMLALGAFAGLRTASVLRLEKSDVRKFAKGILLPADKHKTGRRHLAQPLPDNLWPWLERASDKIYGGIGKREFEERRKDAAERAGVVLPRGWGRHSFVTYYAAKSGSVEAAGSIAGHRDSSITWEHYRGNASQADGEAWFEIYPPEFKGLSVGAKKKKGRL